MINIRNHNIWKNQSGFKKQSYLVKLGIAKNYARFLNADKFIGIIGTVGKTTTAIFCKAVLAEKLNVISSTDFDKNVYDTIPLINIPSIILRTKPKTDKVILELGIDLPGEMDFLLDLVKPNTVIMTNLSFDHYNTIGDLNMIIDENIRALKHLSGKDLLIVNWDDAESRKVAENSKAQIVYYGTNKDTCHVWASNITISELSTTFELNYGVERVEIKSNLLGKHQIYSLLAAAALGLSQDVPLFTLKKALERVKPLPHHMQLLPGFNNSTLIDDTCDIQLIDLEGAIMTLNDIPCRRRILVLGEIKDMGEMSEKVHRSIGRIIYENKIDLVFTGTGDISYTEDELLKLGFNPERLITANQNPQLVSKLLKVLNRGDLVLIKGSKTNRLDEVVDKLTKK